MLFTKSSTAMISLFTLLVAAAPTPEILSERSSELCNGTIVLNEKPEPYVIQRGDTLTSIADHFKRGICDIAKANSIKNINLIEADATITIPGQVCIPDNTSCLPKTETPTKTNILGGPATYVVQQGDTLSAIAAAFQITLAALEAANSQIPNFDLIYPGQVINIPVAQGSQCTIQSHIIKQGDIYYDLANHYGVTVGQIQALNPGVDPTKLQVGQKITIAASCKK